MCTQLFPYHVWASNDREVATGRRILQDMRGGEVNKVRGYKSQPTYHIVGHRLVVYHFIKHWMTTSLDTKRVRRKLGAN